MAEPSHNSYPRSPNPSTRSYDSSSVSSATSPRPPSRYLGGMLGSSSRPSNPSSQSLGIPTLPPVNQGFAPYTSMQHTSSSMMGRESVASTDSLVGSQAGNPAGQGQKRAYRQRRKDPSCDACRERKVKCDATETTSCSECSSRNVKCQFTKETNRRMSSIKQVQDLEKQIERVKRDNSNLRRLLQDKNGIMDIEMESRDSPLIQRPHSVQPEARQRKRPRPIQELARARVNVQIFSKGLWKPPSRYRPSSRYEIPPGSEPPGDIPRHLTDRLLDTYFSTAHTMFPILHMPTFRATVEHFYQAKSPGHRVSPSFLSVFYAVLALGCLFTSEAPTSATFFRPAEFLDMTRNSMDPWCNNYTLDDARAMVLITICLNEMNLKSAAWSWLGRAVRVAQDLGLYIESEIWPVVEGEMRRRTWWTIYILDRVLATELGHPFLIQEAQCSVPLPAAVDDQYIGDDGIRVPNGAEPLTHSMLAVIHVVRLYSAIDNAMESPTLPITQLAAFDEQFNKCLSTFPPACDPASAVALSPHFLAPLAYLFHARLLLHRHNLNPSCDMELRLAAIERCTHIAMETASVINRTSSPAEGTTTLFTMHVFRCTLFLLLTGYWDQALVCIRALSAIDARRDVTMACGRYLSFFTSTLANKRVEHSSRLMARTTSPLAYGPPPPQLPPPAVDESSILMSLAQDEELLAYVSADLHASPARSWLWGGDPSNSENNDIGNSSTGNSGSVMDRETPDVAGASGRSRVPSLFDSDARTGLTEEERRDWGGWGRLDAAVRNLRSSTNPPPSSSSTTTPCATLACAANPTITTPSSGPPLMLQQPHQPQQQHQQHIKSESPVTTTMIHRIAEAPRYGASEEGQRTEPRKTASTSGRDRISIANII